MRRLLLHPLFAFNATWWLVIGLYWLRVCNFFEPSVTILLLYGASLPFFVVGLGLGYHFAGFAVRKPGGNRYAVRMRRGIFVSAWLASVATLLNNYRNFGPPPLFSIGDSLYLEYGSFNVIWQATLLASLWSAWFFKGWRRLALIVVPCAIFVIYFIRGYIVLSIIVSSVLFLLLRERRNAGTSAPRRRRTKGGWAVIIGAAILVVVLMNTLGELREGAGLFLIDLDINPDLHHLGTGPLWVMAYVSGPIDNLVYWADFPPRLFKGAVSLFWILPSFIGTALSGYEAATTTTLTRWPANTALSYIGPAFLDFRWAGLAVVNVIYGVVGGFTYRRHVISVEHTTTYAFVLASIYLLFFNPYLLAFPMLAAIFVFRKFVIFTSDVYEHSQGSHDAVVEKAVSQQDISPRKE